MRYHVHDHVMLKDKRSGIIQFCGHVKFARGEWYGITLDDLFTGKNDGQVKGKRYFKCAKNKGVFIKKEKISKVLPSRKLTSVRRTNVSKSFSLKSNHDTELNFKLGGRVECDKSIGKGREIACATKKRVQIKKEKRSIVLPSRKPVPALIASVSKSSSLKPNRNTEFNFKLGGRVQCDKRVGTVKWIGMIGIASYLGVELDDEFNGKNNGSAKGKSYFKCRTGQGIFWRTERVQHWPDSNNSAEKMKLDPKLQVKLKSPRRRIFIDENKISTKVEKSREEQRDANSTPLSTTEELQSMEQINKPKNIASPSPWPIEVKQDPLSSPRSCRTQQKRGRMASPVPSFIHSSFPKSSHDIRKSTWPLLVNIAGLVHTNSQSDNGSPIETKHQRARSLSTKPESIEFNENIEALTRVFEKIKREKKRENDSKKDHIESQGDNSALVSEIQELRKCLESVKLEKTIAVEAKVAAEKAKNIIEKLWNELKHKLANAEDQIREERRLMEEDRELFCLEKAEFERNRRRLQEEVLAREDIVSVQKELEGKRWAKEELKQEVEQITYQNLPASDLEVKQRRSVRKKRSRSQKVGKYVEEITESKFLKTTKSEPECGSSSPHLSSDSEGSFLVANIIDKSTEVLASPHKGARRYQNDDMSPNIVLNILSDSTCFSEDDRKPLTSIDLYSEISSMIDQSEPPWSIVTSSKHESIGSSLAEVKTTALLPTNMGESQRNGGLPAPLAESKPISCREDNNQDEHKEAEGASSAEAARRQLMKDFEEEDIDGEKLSHSAYVPFSSLGESDHMNNLFNFSESLDQSTQSSAGEKESSKAARHAKFHRTHSEQKVLKTQKLRKKSRRNRKKRMENSRLDLWSDSSGEDTHDFKSRNGGKPKISQGSGAQKLLGDIDSSEDSQRYVTKRKSAMIYSSKRRPRNCRRPVSENQVDYNSLDRLFDTNDPYQVHFLDKASWTAATLPSNGSDSCSQHIDNIEGKVKCIRNWIEGVKEEISTIEINPKTFDEVKVILGKGRTKLIQQKLTELRNLIGSREDHESAGMRDHGGHLATMVEECERQLLKVGTDWRKKIGILSWKVKKNLASLLDDYWKRAKGVREELAQIQREYTFKNHPRYDTMENFQIDVRQMQSNNAKIKILTKNVEQLREFGEFLGYMKTPKTEDCVRDAKELGNVLEAVSKKVRETTETLKSEYIKKKRRESKKNGSKDYSSRYLNSGDRSDINTRTECQEQQKNP